MPPPGLTDAPGEEAAVDGEAEDGDAAGLGLPLVLALGDETATLGDDAAGEPDESAVETGCDEAQAATEPATRTASAPAPSSEPRVRCPAGTDLPAMLSPLSERAPWAAERSRVR
jgi:hypothetical protein